MRLHTMNTSSENLPALILSCYECCNMVLNQQVMQHWEKVQMWRKLFQQNLNNMKQQYNVDKMAQKYQLIIMLKIMNHWYYPLTLDQMIRLQLNQYQCYFGVTRHKLLHVVPDIPVIRQQKLHFQTYQQGLDIWCNNTTSFSLCQISMT